MEYHDPNRAEIAHRPAYCSTTGKPIAPVPALQVLPHSVNPNKVEIGCWLMEAGMSSSYYVIEVAVAELSLFFQAWIANPESVLDTQFRYHRNPKAILHPPGNVQAMQPRAVRKTRPVLTLADLGLADS